MKKCPCCNNIYSDYDIYCPKDNHRLIKDESATNKIDTSEPLRDNFKICPHCKKHFNLNQEKCPDCDLYLETRRNGSLRSDSQYLNTQILSTQNKPTCPTCHSTNLSKITTAHKVGKMALFGVFGMGDNGKTWKCNNCGSRF